MLQRSHARAHDDPLNKPKNVQTTKNLRENKSTPARSCPPRCHLLPFPSLPSLPPRAPRYIATTGSATARHVFSLPAPHPPPATRRARRGAFSGRPVPASVGGRADVAVPAALLPAAARWARRDLRQHPRCVRFLGPVLGNLAILAGCVCANLLARAVALGALLDLFVGGFLEVTRPAAPTRVTRTRLFSALLPISRGGKLYYEKKEGRCVRVDLEVQICLHLQTCRVEIALPRLCGLFVPVGSVCVLT